MGAFDIWDELTRGGWSALSQWRADQRPEGLHLDFKKANWIGADVSDDDKKNLAKNLSGFGNVDGGVLVYGAATTVDPTTKLETLNSLTGVTPLDRYEERLRLFVKESTVPPVPGVIVEKIEDPAQPNHGVVIVYIPVTDAAPFRARGPKADVADKYFMRTTSDTLVMPHQILAAMFGRRPPPRLRIGLHWQDGGSAVLIIENTGRGPAVAPFVRVKFDGPIPRPALYPRGSWIDQKFDAAAPTNDWMLGYGLPPGQLIYPGEQRQIIALDVGSAARNWTFRIDCENAQPVVLTGSIKGTTGQTEWISPTEPS